MNMTDRALLQYCRSQPIRPKSPERLAAAIKNAVASGEPIDRAIETLRKFRPELFLGRNSP